MAAPVQDEHSVFSIPRNHGAWTVDEWLQLPPGKPNVELVDGLLVVSPVEAFPNRRLMKLILRQFDVAAPTDMEAMPDCNAALADSSGLIPDFVVTDLPGFEGTALPAEHFVLVGEIASPSTRRYDRTTKRTLYAEAGIRYLMLVDPGDPPVAELYELHGAEYVEIARSVRGVLTMSQPFPVVLDLTDPRRPPTA